MGVRRRGRTDASKPGSLRGRWTRGLYNSPPPLAGGGPPPHPPPQGEGESLVGASPWPQVLAILAAAALLLWPAVWNGYPIVFADTGTYLSQAVHHYLGWDRPAFYSFFILPLHLTITTWPIIVVQCLMTAGVLHALCRTLGCGAWTVLPLTAGLAATTWLPWLACQIMPDIFTPLLVLGLCLLVLVPECLSRVERIGLVASAGFMVAAQQSSVPLSLVLLTALIPLRCWLAGAGRLRWRLAFAPTLMAIAALLSVNVAGYGRFSLAPFGNMFLLARVIYDGPGLTVLQRDCPAAGWRLCDFLDRLPPTSDEFLWQPGSPVGLAGGHKAVSAEADAIITAVLHEQPGAELRAFLANGWEQLQRFVSGDGLEPWPVEVSPWIERDFPAAEWEAYQSARQQRGVLTIPGWQARLQRVVVLAGVALCLLLLPLALWRRQPVAGFLAVVLLALPASALINGGLSTPHDRYQSRVMWLAPCLAAVASLSLVRRSG
jgi:hypothetical protein